MNVFLNGARVDCAKVRTIEELVRDHQLPPETTLVEHNGTALRRAEWSDQLLQENDHIEILRVAAGG